MEVEVTQENLNRALSNISRVANSKNELPILKNILLRTDGNRLLLAATNLEISSKQRIGAKIVKKGSLTVPARLVSEFVTNLPKETITLKVDGKKLHITSKSNSAVINGMSDEDFPELPTVETEDTAHISLNVDTFKDAATQTIITASNDATRPVLTGVYWVCVDGELFVAATDGYRLSERKLQKTSVELSAIVPTTTMQEVMRVIHDDIDTIDLYFNETEVGFVIGDNEIISRLIDGKYPDYKQLIPKKNTTSFVVDTDELKRIVKISSLFTRDSSGTITLDVDTKSGSVEVRSITSELGENKSIIETKTTGESQSISLNSRYLIDAFSVVNDKTIEVGFSNSLSPCVITPQNNHDYIHIVMPIKS